MSVSLFDQRKTVALKLKECIRDRGFTKVSFAEKVEISRPTLDRLLNGTVENKTTFDRHFQKILRTLNMSEEELLFYNTKPLHNLTAVYSKNAPSDHKMSDTAKQQYELLLDIIDLCTIYY